MSRTKQILNEIRSLLEEGMKLQPSEREDKNLGRLGPEYESWYTRALSVVLQVVPDRVDDFREAYKLERRKEITYDTYTISDYLIGLVIKWSGRPTFDTDQAYSVKLVRQLSILKAAADIAPSVLRDIRTVLRAELIDDDIEAAKELVKSGHLRSAGVVCGVVLEAHLGSIAARHGIKFRKKHPTISDYNDALKDKVYDTPMWRFIQRLGDIRNLCAHAKDREPTRDEVDDLIAGTEKVTKEVY
jgi:hypothetical protein